MQVPPKPLRQRLNQDYLVKKLRSDFDKIPDHRASNVVHQLPDVLISAYAMFALKYPSLNSFEQQTKSEKQNLHNLFGVEKLCSDAQMRRVLDEVNPEELQAFYGKVRQFSWVTSIKLHRRNVHLIMKAARSRWKIENETFNTLKNQGYHFEHNYGHGYKHLSNVLALIMLLAFLIDQILQTRSRLFTQIELKVKTKKRLWMTRRALFSTTILASFDDMMRKVACEYEILLE